MVKELKPEMRPAAKLEAGGAILGAYVSSRTFDVPGNEKPSTVHTFRPLGPTTTLFDYWGGAAMLDAALKLAKPNDPLFIVHRGKEKREGLRKGTEINVIETFQLEDGDIVKLCQAGVQTDRLVVAVDDAPDILKALGLPPLKVAAAAAK